MIQRWSMSDRIVKKISEDLIVTYPKDWKKKEKDCPQCKYAFRDKSDVVSYLQYGVCTDCRLENYKKEYTYKEKE